MLVHHQYNLGEFEAKNGGLGHQEAIATEIENYCRYGIGVELVLYSPPEQKLGCTKDQQVTKNAKDVPTPQHLDQEEEFF